VPPPESFVHVARKTADLDRSLVFSREEPGGGTTLPGGRGTAADDVAHAALAVGDKWIDLFEDTPYGAAGLVGKLPPDVLRFGVVVDDAAAASAALDDAGGRSS